MWWELCTAAWGSSAVGFSEGVLVLLFSQDPDSKILEGPFLGGSDPQSVPAALVLEAVWEKARGPVPRT